MKKNRRASLKRAGFFYALDAGAGLLDFETTLDAGEIEA